LAEAVDEQVDFGAGIRKRNCVEREIVPRLNSNEPALRREVADAGRFFDIREVVLASDPILSIERCRGAPKALRGRRRRRDSDEE